MEPLLVYPDPPPIEVTEALQIAGLDAVAVSSADEAMAKGPEEGWTGAVISAVDDGAMALCRALRRRDDPVEPLLLIISYDQIEDLELRDELYDDFLISPVRARELETRVRHLFWKTGRGTHPDLVEYGPLILNIETYQAVVDNEPLDLTYMEYELLKFLATHPGKVFSREVLLSRVWGYDYYGGARTVDVHIRRLRAKLGEGHASLIQTVRSVGYRFGQSRWIPGD